MILNPDFKEFIQSLNDNNVQYLIVEGYAVAFHGHPRYTKDLDIWIKGDPVNAGRLLKALDDFGFGSLDLKKEDFLDSDQVVQLGVPPNRIDLLNDLKGIDFDDCYYRRIEVELENCTAKFIHRSDLITNKKATGRYQDLADIENLGGPDN
ncbi:hypothetical protein SAMN05443144_108168 [Fodinibius roseus]|uniref:Nucleotidyltransferase n=1 Tax=Fodinibius roseus TaxID=1194090 RepID=A0A1M5BLH8_9BACT|nr:hypothetical protein [Fodinibius roseus]SHF43443.1 hypothetical protein SAMN05443144_108168 [Fodinibius roseus]